MAGVASFYFDYYRARVSDCPGLNLYWNILRADGETELYTVVNEAYHYGREEEYNDAGIEIYGQCFSFCESYLWIRPTDQRYDGAQVTAILNIPECSDSPYSSDTITLHIQGQI